jgi:hypothetical protein
MRDDVTKCHRVASAQVSMTSGSWLRPYCTLICRHQCKTGGTTESLVVVPPARCRANDRLSRSMQRYVSSTGPRFISAGWIRPRRPGLQSRAGSGSKLVFRVPICDGCCTNSRSPIGLGSVRSPQDFCECLGRSSTLKSLTGRKVPFLRLVRRDWRIPRRFNLSDGRKTVPTVSDIPLAQIGKGLLEPWALRCR